MTIKATRILTGEMVRKVCIENHYFTSGTNEQYANMLAYADRYTDAECMNDMHIYEIAKSIVQFTTWLTSDYTDKEAITSVMFILSKASCTLYEIRD